MNNKKILLLVCPPFWERLPPLGIAYLADFLQRNGYRPVVFDLNARLVNALLSSYKKDWTINRDYIKKPFFDHIYKEHQHLFQEFLNLIVLHSIDYAGFSVFNGNREFTLSTARLIKEKFPGIKIILGGPETFTMKQEGFRTKGIDHFVIGEGEEALLALLNGKTGEKTLEMKSSGFLEYFPRYERMDLSLYSGKGCMPVLMSRGCYNKCRFCMERLIYPEYRIKKAGLMFEEIQYHYKNNGIRRFTFYDSIFNGNLPELDRLLDLIIRERLKIAWDAQIAVRKDMDLGLMKKMKQSGCINLFIGLESGSSSLLKKMNKHFTAGEARGFFQKLKRAGLQFEASLIAHYPGETEKNFRETLSFIKENKKYIPKIAQISLFRNYPGTTAAFPDGYQEDDGLEKIDRMLDFLKAEGIPYTKSYVNNLI